MTDAHSQFCSDCETDFANVDRRQFVKAAGGAALAAGATAWLPVGAFAAPSPKSEAETNAAKLYATLSDDQKKTICFDYSNRMRSRANANWKITKPSIGTDFYTKEQQKLIAEIFKGITSKDGHARFMKQFDEDYGGFDLYHVALFGEPGGKFEFVLTGRHHTIRADGNSAEGMAFGGPLVYGHSDSNPAENYFHYQTKQANKVFAELEGKQRKQALLGKAPRENQVQLQGRGGSFPGIDVGELSEDMQGLVAKTVKTILAPYRSEDVDEAMQILKVGGGVEKLHMAFYTQGDLKNDKVWDVWRIEGPTLVCHFRGAPHVHAYIHIGKKRA